MAWTAPKTWALDDPLDEDTLNQYIRDNQNHLKDRLDNNDDYILDEGANYTTTSTTFVDVDATDLAITIDTNGGDVLVGFSGTVINVANHLVYMNVAVDGVNYLAGGMPIVGGSIVFQCNAGFVMLVEGLAAGSHTFKLRWKTSSGTITMAATGEAGQFWVQEI